MNERDAARACRRLQKTAAAVLTEAQPEAFAAALLGPLAEADDALDQAGLAGNELGLLAHTEGSAS